MEYEIEQEDSHKRGERDESGEGEVGEEGEIRSRRRQSMERFHLLTSHLSAFSPQRLSPLSTLIEERGRENHT